MAYEPLPNKVAVRSNQRSVVYPGHSGIFHSENWLPFINEQNLKPLSNKWYIWVPFHVGTFVFYLPLSNLHLHLMKLEHLFDVLSTMVGGPQSYSLSLFSWIRYLKVIWMSLFYIGVCMYFQIEINGIWFQKIRTTLTCYLQLIIAHVGLIRMFLYHWRVCESQEDFEWLGLETSDSLYLSTWLIVLSREMCRFPFVVRSFSSLQCTVP